jgi:hypothetical protein
MTADQIRKNQIITVAGYAAIEEQWRAFEAEVEPIFAKYGVRVLHTTDLHSSDGEFRGWIVLRKQAFVAENPPHLSRHALLGMSMSALKAAYASHAG